MLKYLQVETSDAPDACVIWLHGLGASGHDFEAAIPELGLDTSLKIRFIFPHAPQIPVTVNGGYVMPAWYDILQMGEGRKINKAQLIESAAAVTDLINHQIDDGINSQRIVLAGFSQGGAVAYHAALMFPRKLAGLLALSTYFATAEEVRLQPENSGLPVMVMHGEYDPVVTPRLGREALGDLVALGLAPVWRTYAMEHSVCMPQLRDIGKWIAARLS
ncbi:alpha/beta hydrolase [Parasalinivibrio latis]|uniref:alpha/beta hydrolase n=1 Tax=Parasalinivibrio latis TaxID=2952610 RepID=UPI0030DDE3A2